MTPEIEAPSTLPVSAMPSSRAIATWRWLTGTRSPISAIATGNTPPATSPATIRMATSSGKLVATAQTSAASATTNTQTFISRVLPKKSPVDAEHRLDQRIRKREGGRQQRRGLHVDGEIGGDHAG